MDDEKAKSQESESETDQAESKKIESQVEERAKDEALAKALEQENESSEPAEDDTFVKPDYESEIIKIIRSTTSPKVTRESWTITMQMISQMFSRS
ncbi:MAG: hypothetical protein ACLS3U_05440 [Lachnospiraceae bacterium]